MSQNQHLKASLLLKVLYYCSCCFFCWYGDIFFSLFGVQSKWVRRLVGGKAERFVLLCKLVNKNWFERLRPIPFCIQDKVDMSNEFKNNLENEAVNYL